jgi:hypothetical protein
LCLKATCFHFKTKTLLYFRQYPNRTVHMSKNCY